MSTKKVPVLERTLIKRVNRAMAENGHKLVKNKKTRSKTNRRKLTKREIEFGTYFIVKNGKTVVEAHVDLEELARRCEVLAPYETLLVPEEG